jgi:hemerythrin-like domain-containing protein
MGLEPKENVMGQLTTIAPAKVLERNHLDILALCNELEQIADLLPNDIDRKVCLEIGRTVTPLTARTHRVEENALFPALLARQPKQAELAATLDRLRLEHYGDECHAEEVQDALVSVGEGRPRLSADALGYLLRGFFEGQRRHIAFEQEVILPLLVELPAAG